ncbi:peptidylprolyl isomerase [Gorillibacterium massiliense]|uniref:peptidylprolyl isomerase n=1 Tax=Gorillibacterium massiliense TaxID=1280390 RepID=UPI0004B29DCC|nr:peptidylprolyl isomerase [Gorillibacterium massiliense]
MKKLSMAAAVAALCLAVFASGCGTKESKSSETGGEAATQQQNAKSWSSAPAMTIDKSKTYQAVFKTDDGDFTIDLFAKEAPITVNNFVFLANHDFYDGVKFHRIMKTFMIQTGDPTGTGSGGPGYTIEDELNSPYSYEPGIVAMANTGTANTGGSQFFICTGEDSKNLDNIPNYTIFGKISSGMDIVQKVADTPVKASERGELSVPTQDVLIRDITIVEK